MKNYHFSVNGSEKTVVGFSAVVRGVNKLDAVERLKSLLGDANFYPSACGEHAELGEKEFAMIHINWDNLRVSHIDEVYTDEGDKRDG